MLKKFFSLVLVILLLVGTVVQAADIKPNYVSGDEYFKNFIMDLDDFRELEDASYEYYYALLDKDESRFLRVIRGAGPIIDEAFSYFLTQYGFINKLFKIASFVNNYEYNNLIDVARYGHRAIYEARREYMDILRESHMDIDMCDVEFFVFNRHYEGYGEVCDVEFIQGGGRIERLHLRGRGWISSGGLMKLLEMDKKDREIYLNQHGDLLYEK